MQGVYTKRDRRKALHVQLWIRVPNGMRDHMKFAAVDHNAHYICSLAIYYAHLGEATLEIEEYDSSST